MNSDLALNSETSSKAVVRAHQPSILLVDDDAFMLEVQSHMLRSLGYSAVTTSGNATTTLDELLSGSRFADVIVCDLNMPIMDGVEFLQCLSSSTYCGSVILLSAESPRVMHTVQKLLSGGRLTVLGGLEKPALPQALCALIDCWVPPGLATTPSQPPLPITAEEIRTATEDSQWLLHYQPKIDLAAGSLIGVEALVRWNHPKHGLLLPGAFIPLVEESDEIDVLTEWVLTKAVDQLARWMSSGLKLHMAINVSMDNLLAAGFSSKVGNIVRDKGVSPQDVTLEITESRTMSPSPAPLENLVRLRLQRFNLSIDDFGTGHSTLAQLRDVPFTELKVDRGFVNGAAINPIIRPMLEGSIGLAKRLGMVSVAEGVENERDFRLLRELGCDVAQGYFIGRPMRAEQLPEWTADWHDRRRSLFEPAPWPQARCMPPVLTGRKAENSDGLCMNVVSGAADHPFPEGVPDAS